MIIMRPYVWTRKFDWENTHEIRLICVRVGFEEQLISTIYRDLNLSLSDESKIPF